MKLRCLIIEDEPPAMEIMQSYVQNCPQLELAGSCSDAFAAVEFLQSERIGLIFLDINLPRLSGLSFLKSLSNPPMVIFTTAYPEYAVDGFEADAVDYLVKPFSFDRFLKAVNKALTKAKTALSANTPVPDNSHNFILLRSEKKVFRVNLADVEYIEATGDYLKVFLTAKTLIIHETIKGLCEQLPPGQFLRVHKSFIVSLDRINYLEGNMIHISNRFIPIGRSYKEEVDKSLNRMA
jgi:DNA-binding LytR/AlgR family response regulator